MQLARCVSLSFIEECNYFVALLTTPVVGGAMYPKMDESYVETEKSVTLMLQFDAAELYGLSTTVDVTPSSWWGDVSQSLVCYSPAGLAFSRVCN